MEENLNSRDKAKKGAKATALVPDFEHMAFSIDHIKCPKCLQVQSAKIIQTWPFPTYIHDCVKCGFTITESEWDSVQ